MKQKVPLFFFLLLVILLGLVLSYNVYTIYFTDQTRVASLRPEAPSEPKKKIQGREKRSSASRPKDERPKVAIIIDDLGYDPQLASDFVHLGLPLTLSILPATPFGRSIGREARKGGMEVLLHQPMEPADYPVSDPGPGALLVSMSEADIRRVLNDNLKMVPGAKGINNHMGSGFTADREKMRMFIRVLKKRDLFFVDSRTTRESVALDEAKRLGVRCRSRDIFLDNRLDPLSVNQQLDRLLKIAEKTGGAIGIGHPHRVTLGVLTENRRRLERKVQVVPVSMLVMENENNNKKSHLYDSVSRRK